MSLKMGHWGLKTRSPGQILKKPCICSGCHIFSPTLLKISQNVCLYNILDEFEKLVMLGSKTGSIDQML